VNDAASKVENRLDARLAQANEVARLVSAIDGFVDAVNARLFRMGGEGEHEQQSSHH
jgi:hypothetical protein